MTSLLMIDRQNELKSSYHRMKSTLASLFQM